MKNRSLIRLKNGTTCTLLWTKGNRARVHFNPGTDLPNTGPHRVPNLPGGQGHDRTIKITDIEGTIQ